MKKTDLMKAIDKFDAEIAKHQQEIDSLQTSKAMLEAVAKEKNAKRTKKPPATASKRAAKTSRASASASDNGTAPVSPALFDQQA